MPVARIYTRVPEEATALSERLRARGFTVETADPADFDLTPADLEIHLERTSPQRAFAAAARFARATAADVLVGPGLPVEKVIGRIGAGGGFRGHLLDAWHAFVAAVVAPLRHVGKEVYDSRAARRARAIERETERELERQRMAEARAEQKRLADERLRTAEEHRAAMEAAALERKREEEERRAVERSALAEQQRQAAERQRQEEQRQAQERALALARMREEEQRLAAEREAALARRREEEARLATQQEDSGQHEAVVAEQARAAALERQRAARLQRERQEAELLARHRAAAARERQRESLSVRRASAPVSRPRPAYAVTTGSRDRAWKRALATAAGLALFAAIGWAAYSNRAPAAPLSGAGASIEQYVPFGSAQAKPAAPPPAATAPVQTAPPAARSAVRPAPAAKPAPQTRTRRYAEDDVDMIAEDEVVFHRKPQRSNVRAQNGSPEVKRYSDRD